MKKTKLNVWRERCETCGKIHLINVTYTAVLNAGYDWEDTASYTEGLSHPVILAIRNAPRYVLGLYIDNNPIRPQLGIMRDAWRESRKWVAGIDDNALAILRARYRLYCTVVRPYFRPTSYVWRHMHRVIYGKNKTQIKED